MSAQNEHLHNIPYVTQSNPLQTRWHEWPKVGMLPHERKLRIDRIQITAEDLGDLQSKAPILACLHDARGFGREFAHNGQYAVMCVLDQNRFVRGSSTMSPSGFSPKTCCIHNAFQWRPQVFERSRDGTFGHHRPE